VRRQQKKSDKKEKDKKGAARCLPQGRYAKRELNKNVKGYSAKDLGAILGVVVPGGDAWGSVAAEEEEELQVESEEEEKAEKARKAEATRKKRCLIVIEAPELEAEKLTAEKQAKLDEFFRLAPDWWGAKVFRSSGRLGDIKKTDEAEDGAEVKRGFEEADQERLYNATHAGATSGKQGLGIADRTKKVAGARWGGTKKAFVEEEHTEAQVREALGWYLLMSTPTVFSCVFRVKWRETESYDMVSLMVEADGSWGAHAAGGGRGGSRRGGQGCEVEEVRGAGARRGQGRQAEHKEAAEARVVAGRVEQGRRGRDGRTAAGHADQAQGQLAVRGGRGGGGVGGGGGGYGGEEGQARWR
jgi:hypothetical protein